MSRPAWSDWQPLTLIPQPGSDRVLAEILDGGQAFRWNPHADGTWSGIWSKFHARLRMNRGALEWCAPVAGAAATGTALAAYFDAARDYRALVDSLPIRSDSHLAACVSTFPGLRLLRQPFGETLLAYLCSAAKRIVQIKQMMALVAEHHGPPVAERAHASAKSLPRDEDGSASHSLPRWEQLAKIPESALRNCRLGFRARHIHRTALFLKEHPGWLDETEAMPYADAKARLMSLPGVGEKVADCVLLYGGGKLEAFPVDTWILKAMARRYGLTGWRPAQVAQFGRVHFGPLAGLAQQYLFGWERAHGD